MSGHAIVQRSHDGNGRVMDGDPDGNASGGYVGLARSLQSTSNSGLHRTYRRRLPGTRDCAHASPLILSAFQFVGLFVKVCLEEQIR